MATNVINSGDNWTWTNGTGSDVSSGDIVVIGTVLAVALVDIADGATGTVQTNCNVSAAKVSGAVIADGEDLTWDASASAFDDNAAIAATGDVTGPPARAVGAWGSGTTTMEVKLTGVPGTVT